MDLSAFPYDTPALPPPPGQTSNFVNPPSLATALYALIGVFLPLMLVVVGTRLYIRLRVVKSPGWDDITITLAAIASTAHSVILIVALNNGLGKHLWDIRLATLTQTHVKASFAFLFLRLFGRVTRYYRYFIFAYIGLCFLGYTAFMALTAATEVQCANILLFEEHALCKKVNMQAFGISLFNAVTDIILLILPIKKVLGLKLNTRKKAGLVAIFGLGAGACVVSITRLALAIKYNNDIDVFYTGAYLTQPLIVELDIGIIAACLNVLPALLDMEFFTSARSWISLKYRERLGSSDSNASSDRSMSYSDPTTAEKYVAATASVSAVPQRRPVSNPNAIKVETTLEVSSAHENTRNPVAPWSAMD